MYPLHQRFHFFNSRQLYHRLAANGCKAVPSLLASVWRHELIVGAYDLHGAVAPIVRTGVVFNEILQVAAWNVNCFRPEVLAYRTIEDRKIFSI